MSCPYCNSENVISIGDQYHHIFVCEKCEKYWFIIEDETHICAESEEDYIFRRKSNIIIVRCKICGKIYKYTL